MDNEGNREVTPSPQSPPIEGGEAKRSPSPRVGEGGGEGATGLWDALGLAWEMGYTIAVPLVVFALGGRFLDYKLGTSPWLLLTGVIVSIPISTIVIYLKIAKIINKK